LLVVEGVLGTNTFVVAERGTLFGFTILAYTVFGTDADSSYTLSPIFGTVISALLLLTVVPIKSFGTVTFGCPTLKFFTYPLGAAVVEAE